MFSSRQSLGSWAAFYSFTDPARIRETPFGQEFLRAGCEQDRKGKGSTSTAEVGFYLFTVVQARCGEGRVRGPRGVAGDGLRGASLAVSPRRGRNGGAGPWAVATALGPARLRRRPGRPPGSRAGSGRPHRDGPVPSTPAPRAWPSRQ